MEATTGELEAMRQHRDNAENDSSQAWSTGPGREVNMVRAGALGGPRKTFPRFFTRKWPAEREPKP